MREKERTMAFWFLLTLLVCLILKVRTIPRKQSANGGLTRDRASSDLTMVSGEPFLDLWHLLSGTC